MAHHQDYQHHQTTRLLQNLIVEKGKMILTEVWEKKTIRCLAKEYATAKFDNSCINIMKILIKRNTKSNTKIALNDTKV